MVDSYFFDYYLLIFTLNLGLIPKCKVAEG
jgi:hypothetical protein